MRIAVLERGKRLLESSLIQNIVALYGVQFARYLLPLITIPYLTRVLGPEGWGGYSFAYSFGMFVIVVVEYGFAYSATRQIAKHQDDILYRSRLLGGVLGAKGLLSLLVILVSVVVRFLIPFFQQRSNLLMVATLWGVVSASNFLWYFQGLERMKVVAALDISAKLIATILIMTLVRTPADDWKVFVFHTMAIAISVIVALILAYKEVPFSMPSWAFIGETMRMGWSMFVFRGATSLYTVGNAFILGVFVTPVYVGYFIAAERISRGFLAMLYPISQALYPRLSKLIVESRGRAAQLVRHTLLIVGGGAFLIGAGVFVFASPIVNVLLGVGYEPSMNVLRILSLLIPLVALSNILGIQWMLPLGMDRSFSMVVLSAGLVNFVLAVLLAPRYMHIGMAWSIVISELYVTAMIYFILRWRELGPSPVSRKPLRERI